MPRKHIGIIQSGKNAGRLRKGYRFSGKRTKTGLAIIVKTQKRTTKRRKQRGGRDGGPVEDSVDERDNEDNVPPLPPTPNLHRRTAIDGREELQTAMLQTARLQTARREQRERQRRRAQAAVNRMRNRGRTENPLPDAPPRS